MESSRFIRIDRAKANDLKGNSLVCAVKSGAWEWRKPAIVDHVEFTGRLWTLFGVPSHISTDDEVVSYDLEDSETGLYFVALCTDSGTHYGGRAEDHAALLPVLDAFDALLRQTPMADFELIVRYGRLKYGVKDGIPYWKDMDDGE